VQIRLNGEAREVADGVSVARLLAELGVKPHRVAVVVNESVVIRDRRDQHALAPGDAVEIVALMAGC